MRAKVAAGAVALLVVALVTAPAGTAAAAPPVTVCDSPTSTLSGGGNSTLNVNASVVLLLTSGTYVGVVHLRDGGTLCVAADATLEPHQLKKPAGDLIVLGTADLPGFTSEAGFDLVVSGTATTGNVTLDGSSELTITTTGSVTTGTIEANSGSLIDNAGTLDARLSTHAGSTLLNSGDLITRSGLTIDGALRNTGHIEVIGGAFRLNAGSTMSNECVIDVADDVTVNSGSASGVTNAGILRASGGVLRVGEDGVFTQTPDGITVTQTLDNSGIVTGFGRFRFAANTHSELLFGGTSDVQPIVVQDLTPPAPPRVFDQQSGIVVNTVAGVVEDPPPDAVVGTCATHTPVADVVLSKTGPANVSPGGTVNYAVTVHNAGPDTATGVVVTDTLPPQLTNVVASGGGIVSGGTVTWNVASLANQADITFSVTGFAPLSGTLTNTVSSTSTTSDPNPSNNNGSTPGQAVTTRVNGQLPAGNLPPVLEDVVTSTRATQTVAGAIAISDPDEGQEVVTELATQAAHGVATVSSDGVFEYTPAGSFTGIDEFTIEGCDNYTFQLCATGTVTVVVAPLAVRDGAETTQNVAVSIPVLTNDVGDSTGGPQVVYAPAHGAATTVGQEILYTPTHDYIGPDLFTYRICSDPVTVCGEAVVAVNVLPANLPPDAQASLVRGPADAPVSGRVWASDPNFGQVVTFDLVAPPTAGTAVVEPDGRFTYTPPDNTSDLFTFQVRACDDYVPAACDVVGVIAAIYPAAQPDLAETVAGTPVTFSLTANDRGGVGTPTVTAPGPANGTATIEADGQATYTPEAGFTGVDSFHYTVCGTAAPTLCTTGTASVTVDEPPPPVTVQPLTLETTATIAVTGDLTYNYAASDLSFTVTTPAVNGTSVVDANGRVTYDPFGAFTGRNQFTVQACLIVDPANCGTGVVSVTVFPKAGNDSATVESGRSVDIPVAGNDIGVHDRPHDLSTPANGTTEVLTAAIRYTPDAGFVGTDNFTYTICSTIEPDTDVCATATVTVHVTAPTNRPPTANDFAVTGPADASVSGIVSVSDPDPSQTLTVTLLTAPLAGTVVVDPDGSFTFTPPANTSDIFTFTVQVCDSFTPTPACDSATVTATITPVAHLDSATTTEGVPVTFSLTGNDRGGVGTPTLVAPTPTSGTAVIEADGQVTYTPNAGFTGQDTFGYQVCATAAPALCTTGTATVAVGAAPAPPVTVQPLTLQTEATVTVTGDLTFNTIETDLDFTVTIPATDGTGTVDAAGRVTYTPNGLFTGRDQFTVQACLKVDPANCGTGVVSVTVLPVALNDVATVVAGGSVDIPVEANDVGAVGPPQDLTQPANGTAQVTASILYSPNGGFVGTDTFTYTICSTTDTDVCATATVTVEVTSPPNLPPVAQDASVTGPADAPVSGQVDASDPDVGQTLTFTLLTAPTAGAAVVNPDGSFTFTPPANTADVFPFTVEVCDNSTDQLCDQATVTATITPVARPDAATTTEGVPVTFPLTANDSGGVGAPVVTTGPANGTATIEGDGQATYTPGAGFTGDDSFEYTVCATAEPTLCVVGSANVHVDLQPLPPVEIQDEALTTTATVPAVADLTFNYAAVDLTFTVSSGPANGAATVDDTGRVVYDPTFLFTGRDQFTVQGCLKVEPANCGTALITVTVLPVAQDDTATVQANRYVDIPVEANDVGNVGAIQDLTQPANGTAEVTASVLYTPNEGFVGTDSFTYTICSTVDLDVCATATVHVSVRPLATGDVLATEAGAPGTQDLLANDVAGSDPVATIVSGPAEGTASIDGALLTYTPLGTFTGHDQLIYQVCPASEPTVCTQAQVLIEVSPNVNPVVSTTVEDTAVSIDVAANDFGDAGSPVVTRPPAHGTVTGGGLELVRAVVGTGNADLSAVEPLVYTPEPGFVGADTFLYTRCAESTSLCSETAVVVLVQALVTEPPGGSLPGTGASGVYQMLLASLLTVSVGALLVWTGARRRHLR